ncbi:MAG: hypothetical protein JNL72_10975 [Flavipsychrobacter sp.]|nr:hypothetical protein [Flavipsychrobacter sp.]
MKLKNIYISGLGVLLLAASCNPDDTTTPQPAGTPRVLDCFINSTTTLTDHNPGGIDYIVECDVEIANGANLAIEPGVIIEFRENASLWAMETGTLSAVGTPDKPVVFRPADGARWDGIVIKSANAQSTMNHCAIEAAGTGDITFSHVVAGFIKDYQSSLTVFGKASLNNITIAGSKGMGLSLSTSCTPQLANIKVSNCALYPIYMYAGLLNSSVDLASCTFTTNNQQYIALYSFSSNNVVDNPVDIKRTPVPYLATESLYFKHNTLIQAGVELAVDEELALGIENAYMKIMGTASQPVTIRGKEAGAGYWYGLLVNSDLPENVFDYLNISGGGFGNLGHVAPKTNIGVADVQKASLTLNNCTSTYFNGCQVSVSSTDGALVNNSPSINIVCTH